MSNFVKVTIFSLFVIGVYTLFSVKYVPPIKPEEPPKEEAFDEGSMTVDEFVSLGEVVYNGKGACTLCHTPVGGRAPLLDNIATVASERIKGAGYKGSAKTAEEYIRESMVSPSAYVAAGFGVTGTNDKESPMPDVRTGSIGLNETEIKAVIAYLQRLGGAEVTVVTPPQAQEQNAMEGKQ
ncbi:MAG: c-type cytochrome [Deltaproteobacteria bacterium]|nr:c-type cytochrome [Deltaproteobacteria bacterium]